MQRTLRHVGGRTTLLICAIMLVQAIAAMSLAQERLPATHDFGDAPTSINHFAATMEAYPGVIAHFPTTLAGESPGPVHTNTERVFFLGRTMSGEAQADTDSDSDGQNNVQPLVNSADGDGGDDGLTLPETLPHCQFVELEYRVTTLQPSRPYLNIWIDWDRNGTWSQPESLTCPDGTLVKEWAVQNQRLSLRQAGLQRLTVQVPAWYPEPDRTNWLRISLSDTPAPAADGSAARTGYQFGETEDYLVEASAARVALPTAPELDVQPFTAATIPEPDAQQSTVAAVNTFNVQIFLPLVLRDPNVGNSPEQPPVGTPPGQLREVAVAHIGGPPNGPNIPIVVTAAGTGANVRLSSWDIDFGSHTPRALQDSRRIIGHDVQLHVLTPDVTPTLEYELLLSAVIRDGNLWLTSWRVDGDGTFTQLASRGYGANADVQVKRYAIAHRELRRAGGRTTFQVVTPILSTDNQLRTITWSVNPTSGEIVGQQDSGDWEGDPHPDTGLSVARIEGSSFLPNYYAVGYRSRDNHLTNYFWSVSTTGTPSYRGQGVSGVTIRGNNEVEVPARHVAIGPLRSGFVSVVHDGSGDVELISWDNQLNCFGDTGCFAQPHYLSDDANDESPDSNGVDIDVPTLTANRAYLLDANYEEELLTRNVGSSGPQGIASVTKVMTLIITLEAIAAGEVSFDDEVTVSAAAAQVGGSQTGFSEGEIQTLRTLLYSLMVDSGNDAAVAIAEHVGEAAGGDMDTFIDRMNQKADDLNMDDTTYCQPAGGCFSTPADQVALWLSVYDDPLFQQFVGPVSYIGCGEDAQGNEVCHSFTRSTSSYPGHDGRKGGSRGFYCDDDFERPSNGGPPLCASGGCTTEQTTRLGRTLIANNLHPLPLSANRWTDTQNMFDYGYRQRFTPDARSAGVNASETANFSLTTLDDTLAVVATIEGQRVRLCSWNAYATSGQLNQLGCAERPINGLVAGDVQPQVQQVQIVGGSTIEADGDFLVGYRDGNSLVLRLWRIGAKDF